MSDYKTIAESKNFIVLDKYNKEWQAHEGYQSEGDLEREFIQDLVHQGYEAPLGLNTPEALLANVRVQLQALNNVQFLGAEWVRFVETWLDKPSDGIAEKTRKVHDDYVHDFVFDDGHIQNIYLLDKKNTARNKLQVIKQFEQTGSHANRYDVSILVNGLPLVQVELKKRGVAIREAFNQVHRYSKESFNRHRQPLLCQHHAAQQKQLRLHHELGEGRQQPDQGPEGLHRHVLSERHAAEGVAALLGL
jgi:type I restriction enzyme, R subunit